MNCEQAHKLWDDYRDGTLDDARRAEFEQHLHDCPDCDALWRRETAWLTQLKTSADAPPAMDALFGEHALRRWGATTKPTVVARLGRPLAWAAVLAMAVTLVVVLMRDASPLEPPIAAAPRDPASILILDMRRSIDAGPQRMRAALVDTVALLPNRSWNELLQLPPDELWYPAFLEDNPILHQ